MSEREPIGVVGAGWVGLVTAACFAELGHRVVVREILAEKVEALERGEVPIHEPGLRELVERNRERLSFTTEIDALLDGPRLFFICVQTPPTHSGDADLSAVMGAVREIEDGEGRALVMKSTVPVGTGTSIKRQSPGLAYVSNPEFLREGTAVGDFMKPDRVVVGAAAADEWAAEAVTALYEPLGAPLVRTDVSSAEMIKLASNAFLATKISFINEIANVCDETGADVSEVARGMGLDPRIGDRFLNAGLGFGGSCFGGSETLLIRLRGNTRLVSFAELWETCTREAGAAEEDAIAPEGLEVWSWVPGEAEPEWMPVHVLTRRDYDGEMIEVRTKMGRRLRVTADHPFVVGDGEDGRVLSRILARDLTEDDWLPLARGRTPSLDLGVYSVMSAIEDGHVPAERVLVKPPRREIEQLAARSPSDRAAILEHPKPVQRMGDIKRGGKLRLAEACAAELNLSEAAFGTVGNGTFTPQLLALDDDFWRVVGLYLAEGCVGVDGRDETPRHRIIWSFHPEREQHLVDEVCAYWERHGIKASVHRVATARRVSVSSRILGSWWTETLGCGRTSYDQRIPDLLWQQPESAKRALLSGLWESDGSWSLINRGPSVILEWGTVSDDLADGVARLLGELGLVSSWRRGRTAKSTKTTHWLRISGAEQVERGLFLVPERDRAEVEGSIGRQTKRIASTGFRRLEGGPNWVRVTATESARSAEPVYSLKVPGSETVVTSGGLIASQCFPKDTQALKMLAGNIGYHFQLLSSVIEVNELQKRRVTSKLTKHLGSLEGKRVALLGLAFKPDTDDMRDASSLVLASRLLGEGATVTAYDPFAAERAKELLPDVAMSSSALDALRDADAAVLVTEWPEFADLDWAEAAKAMSTPLLIDGRNFFDPAAVTAAGLTYEGIGRGTRSATSAPPLAGGAED